MRPYLAILKDSFREALASRVLWIVVLLITLLLLGAAPFSARVEKTADGENAPAGGEFETTFTYFGYAVAPAVPLDREQLLEGTRTVLATVISFLVGTLGVFAAVLVTASIVPNTFEPGSIDLLLSKPVSRPLLFLTKFCGGCAFILLSAAYLVVGLWLIVGAQFGLWDGRLLLSIPVFLFLFAIYYAVSALAGVLWRNAVVSVVVVVIFWAACFTVGAAKGIVEQFLNPQRLQVVLPAEDDTLLAANKRGQTLAWNAGRDEWEPVFEGGRTSGPFGGFYPLIGPVYDRQHDRLIAADAFAARFGFSDEPPRLLIGRREDGWKRVEGAEIPSGIEELFVDSQGRVLAVGPTGIHRFVGDPTARHEPFKVFGLDIAPKDLDNRFLPVGPEDGASWRKPFAAALHPRSDALAVYSAGELVLLEPNDDGRYTVAQSTDLETDEPAVLACAGDTVLVALGDGSVRLLTDELQPKQTDRLSKGRQPRTAVASPDGRWFAVVSHHRKLRLYDAQNGEPVAADLAPQRDISAAAFGDGRLYVAHGFGRATAYGLAPLRAEEHYRPPRGTLELVYRLGVRPIYTVFPKPGELNNMVSYLLTDQESVAFGQEEDLEAERAVFDVWQPVWSNLAFVAVLLTVTCAYVAYKDF